METEETIREMMRKYRKVLYHRKEEGAGAGAVEELKPMRSQKRLLGLGLKKPSEGNVYRGMVAEARFLLQSLGSRI